MKNTVLGLYLSEKTAQALVVERITSRHTLLALHEWDNTLFNYAGDDTPGVDEFVDHLSHFVSRTAVRAEQASVALDTSLLFINTIPFESTATREKIYEQIEWELNEYFPGSPRNAFITDTHVLARRDAFSYDNVIAVSVRRDVVQKLHRALAKLKLRLDIVDADHFSADTARRINYPDTATKYIALVGIKDERIDVSLVRYNEVESYSYYTASSREKVVEQISSLSKTTNGLSSITVFGMNLDKELLTNIRNSSTVLVEALNPFRNVDIASSVRIAKDPTTNPFRYAAAIGVALRQD